MRYSSHSETYEEFWKTLLSQDRELPNFSSSRNGNIPQVRTARIKVNSYAREALHKIVGHNDGAAFVYVLSVFGVIFYRFTGVKNILIHTPPYLFSKREKMTIDFVPLLLTLTGGESWREWMKSVQEMVRDCYNHQNSLTQSLSEFGISAEDKTSNIFVQHTDLHVGNGQTSHDLNFTISTKAEFEIILQYNSLAVDDYFVPAFEACLNDLLVMASLPSANISASELSSPRAITNFDRHSKGVITIPEFFKAQVLKHKDKIALRDAQKTFSYSELDEITDCLANYLIKEHNTQKGGLIGLGIQNSLWTIIGILAIIKTGNGYVPIDVSDPVDRIQYKLMDSGVEFLLLQSAINLNLPLYVGKKILFDDVKVYTSFTNRPLNYQGNIDDPAYVIYTSGTSGKPKGVLVSHSSLINYCEWFIGAFNITANDSSIILSSFAFDLCYTALWGCLMSGATLHVPQLDIQRNPEELASYIAKNNVSFLKLSPSLFYVLTKCWKDNLKLSTRLVVLGGEAIRVDDLSDFMKNHPDVRIANHYGPTETTIGTIFHQISNQEFHDFYSQPVIGSPIRGNEVFILDPLMLATPLGIPGEIYVAGRGVSEGYINQPELTATKFIEDANIQRRIYRTGDIGRWLKNGKIEFLGRADDQIKIRGFRIELSEIEKTITSFPGILECRVLPVKESKDSQKIIAFIVSNVQELGVQLREFLGSLLPGYMIPEEIIQIDHIPLTENGKTDLKILKQFLLKEGVDNPDQSYVNRLELELVEIWKSVLNKTKINSRDNFFELGGHSLKGIEVISLIQEKIKINVNLNQLFVNPTIELFSKALCEEQGSSFYNKIVRQPLLEDYPLSYSQNRLWMAEQTTNGKLLHIQTRAYDLKGNLNIDMLQACLIEMRIRHESLRTIFLFRNGEPRQKILKEEDSAFALDSADLTSETDIENRIKDILREESQLPFNLTTGPLLRARILKVSEQQFVFILTTHHIISDAQSMSVFVRELIQLYDSSIAGTAPYLKPLPIQYKDYAVWQKKNYTSESFASQREYWSTQLHEAIPMIDLPVDYPRMSNQKKNGSLFKAKFSDELHLKITELVCRYRVTTFVALKAFVNILLFKLTRQNDIIIGFPVSGRYQDDLLGLMGIFVNALPLRTSLKNDDSFEIILNTVHVNVINAFAHQEYPLAMMVEELNIHVPKDRSPLFDVMMQLLIDSQRTTSNTILISQYGDAPVQSTVDMYFHFKTNETELELSLVYNSNLFDASTIQFIWNQLTSIIKHCVDHPNMPIQHVFNLIDHSKKSDLNVVQVDF